MDTSSVNQIQSQYNFRQDSFMRGVFYLKYMGNLGHWYHLFPFIFIYFYLFFIISFSMKMISSVREKIWSLHFFSFLIGVWRDTLHPHALYRWVFVLCTQRPLGDNMMAKIEWYAIIMHSGTFASVCYWFTKAFYCLTYVYIFNILCC